MPAAAPDRRTVRGHRLPLSTYRPRIRSGRVLLAGDAQSLINPLTGEGIYTAVVSGELAGRAAVHGAGAGARYRRRMRRELGRAPAGRHAVRVGEQVAGPARARAGGRRRWIRPCSTTWSSSACTTAD